MPPLRSYGPCSRSIGSTRPDTNAVDERTRRERDVQTVNAEIAEYERKRYRDGRLNEYDSSTLRGLCADREEKKSLLVAANGLVIAEQMSSDTGTYDTVSVTDDKTHILQFHVGQAVFGKVCGRWGMPMVLQWQQHLETVRMRDFFWGCAGFFSGTCRNVERFQQSDMDLFTRTDREEFTIPTTQLSSIARSPHAVRMVRRRMDELVNVGNSTYYCPVPRAHGPAAEERRGDVAGHVLLRMSEVAAIRPELQPDCQVEVRRTVVGSAGDGNGARDSVGDLDRRGSKVVGPMKWRERDGWVTFRGPGVHGRRSRGHERRPSGLGRGGCTGAGHGCCE